MNTKNSLPKIFLAILVLVGLTLGGFVNVVRAQSDAASLQTGANASVSADASVSNTSAKPLPPGIRKPLPPVPDCAKIINLKERETCLKARANRIDIRATNVDDRINKIDNKIEKGEDKMDKKEDRMENRQDNVSTHVNNVVKELTAMDERIAKLITRVEGAITKAKTEKSADTTTAEKYLSEAKTSEVKAKANIALIATALKEAMSTTADPVNMDNYMTCVRKGGAIAKTNPPTCTINNVTYTQLSKPTTSTTDTASTDIKAGRYAKVRQLILDTNKALRDAHGSLLKAVGSLRPLSPSASTNVNASATLNTNTQ